MPSKFYNAPLIKMFSAIFPITKDCIPTSEFDKASESRDIRAIIKG
jgi:hypothetical protein